MTAWIAIALGLTAAAPEPALSARELAPGVFALGSSQRFGGANLGWVVFDDHVMLVGAPHPDLVAEGLAAVARVTDKPVRGAIFTHVRRGEEEAARLLAGKGVALIAQSEAARQLRDALARTPPGAEPLVDVSIREFANRLELRTPGQSLEILALGRVTGPVDAAVYLRDRAVLFAGALGINGPRAELPGRDTDDWIRGLERLRGLPARTVVPGFGTIGGPEILARQERFLRELRRQVGHLIAQGRPPADVVRSVRIAPEWLVWMPYDHPDGRDIEHVYRELTVPLAPFGGHPPSPSDPGPRALALIADRPHDPSPIEAGLGRALERAGVHAHFAVDARALTAENLKAVQLLVILRDGVIWPGGPDGPSSAWMTSEQERAIAAFVESGGGLLALHNATGLYREGGPYLRVVGGTYRGHGPLERFRVHVVDRSHPITRGVADFEVADEQHTPAPDLGRVHLLLESRSAEGVVGAAGWAHAVGRGRVCYLANGHTREALDHPEYQKLLRNASLWCLGRDDEAAGR